jgi:hypothetical protein
MNSHDYIKSDKLCESIINEFDVFGDTKEWLSNYKYLYTRFNIQPGKLPAIADCNFEGVKYENISKFHRLYQKMSFEYHILDHKSHEEAIVYFFEQMNSYMIGHYLTEEYYMGMDLVDFFYSLGNAFQELQDRENKQLYTEIVECSNCNMKQYFFKGTKDGSYLHLNFKLEDGIVKDLIECREAKCVLPQEIDTGKQVFLDTITPPF